MSVVDRWQDVPWQEGARGMDECGYLFATDVREIEELMLSITIVEGKPQARTIPVDPLGDPVAILRSLGKPVEPDETCKAFRLIFDGNHMVSYTVLNESYGKYPEPSEEFVGKLFRVYSKSHLLEFTKRTTIVSDEYPGALMHFEIVCQDHVFEVICTAPPTIAITSANGATRY